MKISDMQIKMILHELASIVGREHVIVEQADLVPYTVDIFWLPRLALDRGGVPPMPDVVVIPGSVEEVSAVIKLANI